MTIELSAGKFLRAFMTFVTGLTALSFLTQAAWHLGLYGRQGTFKTFDVDVEASVPTWYSALALALAAVLLALIVKTLRERKQTRDLPRWIALTAGFVFLSVDEIAGFHERAGKLLHAIGRFEGWLRYPWVLCAIGATLFLIPYFFDFLKRMEPRMRRQFVVSGLIFVGGAVGMEIVGGNIREHLGKTSFAYCVGAHIEEFFEMAGIVLFNAALIEYLAHLRGGTPLSVRFVKD